MFPLTKVLGGPRVGRTQGRWWATAALLVLVVFAVFGSAISNVFVEYDDHLYVTDNQMVQRGISAETVRWAFTTSQASNWHPLTWLSHLVDVQLYGLNPRGHHLTSVLLHALNACLFLAVGRALTGSLAVSVVAAVVFAVHPLRVESVAWVSERKDLLSACWFLVGLLCAVAFVRTRRWRWYAALAAAHVLALLAKPMAVSFPIVLLLLDYWPLGRWREVGDGTRRPGYAPAGRLLLEKAPLVLFSLGATFITASIQWYSVEEIAKRLPAGARIGNAAVSLFLYWGKTVWPLRLAYFYPHPGAAFSLATVIAAIAGLAAITILALGLRTRYPWLGLGWFWYLVTVLPVVGIVPVGAAAIADRYTYIPFMGPALALGMVGAAIFPFRRRLRNALTATAAAVAVAAGVLAHRQVGVWRNSWNLATHAVAVTDGNWLALDRVGSLLARQLRWQEALVYYRESIRYEPTYYLSRYDCGMALLATGDYAGAAEQLAAATQLNPRLAQARIAEADARNRFGISLAQGGRTAEALEQFDRAVVVRPDFSEALMNRGNLLRQIGREAEARASLEQAVILAPASAIPRLALGLLLEETGDPVGAAARYREALRLDPGSEEARARLSTLDRASGTHLRN